MAYTYTDLIDIGIDMWREGVEVRKTNVDGIFKCITNGHGGYLVDIEKHPELKKYGWSTYNKQINAFEEDYEALKVEWLYPLLVNNEEWYNNLTIDEVIRYETNNKFKSEFPHKGGLEVNRNNKDTEESL